MRVNLGVLLELVEKERDIGAGNCVEVVYVSELTNKGKQSLFLTTTLLGT
jgi:hypothetical protein